MDSPLHYRCENICHGFRTIRNDESHSTMKNAQNRQGCFCFVFFLVSMTALTSFHSNWTKLRIFLSRDEIYWPVSDDRSLKNLSNNLHNGFRDIPKRKDHPMCKAIVIANAFFFALLHSAYKSATFFPCTEIS